jgi:Wiskott-Aldrich syndrome protein
MNSPGHRANVLEPSFTHGGVGAYARDNVSFLGKLRNPRFYTELFMAAASAPPPPPPQPPPSNPNPPPPPPPPSGGGGTPATAPAAASRTLSERPYRVDGLEAPSPSAPLDGSTLVAAVERDPTALAERALSRTGHLDRVQAAPARVASAGSPLRVEAATAGGGGLVETVLGSLLGFFL